MDGRKAGSCELSYYVAQLLTPLLAVRLTNAKEYSEVQAL